VPYVAALSTYFGYAVLIVYGYLRDFVGRTLLRRGVGAAAGGRRAPLLVDFDDFYTRRLYLRIADCWGRPIASPAGAWVRLLEGGRRVLNLGSYNYLGFGEVAGGVDACVVDALDGYGVGTCDAAGNAGTAEVVVELERTVAEYVGKPAALVMGMGFATNAQLLPAIVGRGDLVLSDALNHASIVVGARSSDAAIRLFDHNSVESLRAVLRAAIAEGDGRRGGRPWDRIFILVEGMYSMEGESPPLRDVVAVKKQYGAYLFVDEAHSIGAMGPTGRGVCEHYGVDPADVDILMGTFTKSFGAVGGYIASSHDLVAQVRAHSAGALYGSAMSPPCARHIVWALRQIAGWDGGDVGARKIAALRDNAIFFRRELSKLRVQTLGDWDSPVIPIMLYNPAKIAAFSRECLARGLAVVVVGFPATPLLLSRARICLSAAHTREDLLWALSVIDEVAEVIQIKYDRSLVERALPARLADLLVRRKSADCLSRFAGHEHCASKCLMRA
jgi:serine palmitoyltransferase